MESEFDTAAIQPLPKLRKTLFKDPSVEKEYGGVNPALQEIIDNAPNPVTVTSGFRDPAKNAAVGGVPNSLHQNGDATDIRYDDKWPENKKYFAQNGVNILEEKDHPHLSYKGKPKTVDDEFDSSTIQPLDAAPDAPDVNKGIYAQPEKTKMQKLGAFINKPLVGKEDLQSALGVNPNDNEQFAHMDPNKLMERGIFKDPKAAAPDMPFNPVDDKETPLSQGVSGAGKSAVDLATGLTTPKNLGMLAVSAANPMLGLAAAAPSIPGMLKGGYEGLKSGKVNRESGNYEKAGEDYTNAIANGLMGLGLAKGVGGVVGSGLSSAAGTAPESITGKTVGALGKGLTALTDTPQPDIYNKSATPDLKKLAQEGAPLDTAAITKNPVLESIQGFLEKNPQAKGIFRKKGLEQEASIGNDVNSFKGGIGQTPSPEVAENINKVTEPEGTYQRGVGEMQADYKESQAQRLADYQTQQQAAGEKLKTLPSKDVINSGNDLQAAIAKANSDLNSNYQKQTAPILKRHWDKPASPEGLRQGIVNVLDRNGMLDEKGNILNDEIEGVRNTDRKSFLKKLAGYSDDLKTNPTVRKLSQITQDLQAEANYGARERTPYEQQFGPLSHAAKESLLDSLEEHVKPDQVDKLRQARETYATTKPVLDELSNATHNKWGEQIVKGAKTNLPNELLQATSQKVPALKGNLGDVVLNNIVQSASSPEALSKAIDSYGRENLKGMLGDKKFSQLMDAEGQLTKTSQPFFKGQAPRPLEQNMRSKLSESLNKVASENPEAIADHVIQPNNPKRVQDYKKLLGDKFDAVKQQFTQKLFNDHDQFIKPESKAETAIDDAGHEIEFSRQQHEGKSLKDNLNDYGSTLKEIYTPEELKQLKQIADKTDASSLAVRANRPPLSPRGLKALVGKLAWGPAMSTASKAWLSDPATRMMSTSLPRPAIGKVALPFNPLTNPLNRGLYKDKQ